MIIIVSQRFFFHLALLSELVPVVEEFKVIHHLEKVTNNLVVNPPYGSYLFVQKPVPIEFSVGDNSYGGLIEIEKLGKFFLVPFGTSGCLRFGHGH